MDIAGLSIAMSTARVSNEVSTAVLSKNLDTMEQMGDGMKKMLEKSVTPELGQNMDIRV
ncbi:MAG: YjfB family protein [Lachnospiraceae bacterium]